MRFSNFETRFDNPEVQFNGNNVNFHNNHTTFNGEVRLEGPITEPKHATTKEYVDALSTRSAARVAALANVDLQNASPEIDGVTLAAGDRVLLAGQTSAAENGLYVADANGALTRAGDFDAANEIDGGAHLFIQEGSQASQGYVLADLGENFELGTGELSFSRFTVDPTQSLELGNDLNVAGTINAQDIQTGNINAERLYLEGGPFGDTRFDGDFNRLGGFETRFEGEFVRFSNFETRFDNPEVQFNGNNVNFHNNHTTFNGEVRLEGPITEPKHATTKEYVDALSTRSAARVASLANVDLQNASPEIDGVTLAAGDRVLLAGQTSAAENGLYVADANGALTRAGDFDAANEIDGGAHLFIQEGSQASQGYVLADLGENFELGTGELSFSRFTVDPTQSLELGNDLNVAGTINAQDIQTGNINAERLYLEGGPFGDTRFDGDFNRLGGFETRFEGEFVRFSNFETRFDNPEVQFNGNNVNFHNNHTTFNGEVRLEGPITEPKHATTKEYVDALSTRSAARVASLANVDLQNASPEIDGVTLAAGDRVLLAGQTSAAENGLYVADANGALTRAGDFDAANEIDGGAHLFIQEGSQASQGYVLADLGENFELGTGELSFSRFTVDPTQSLELGNDLNVAGTINAQDIQTGNINAQRIYLNGPFGDTRFEGIINRISGDITEIRSDLFVERYAQFNDRSTFNDEVRLEGPITDPKHATSKEYVDALSARSAARVAALANVDLQNASPEIDGVTLAAGDRVLLAGQTSAAENGLYVADANGALTRAGDFDNANEIDGGAHLFIQEGSQAGQGYVLADLGENFELGTGELSFSRFTVDPTQSLELGNDLNVAGTINAQDIQTGNINAERLYLEGGPFGDTRFDGDFNRLGGFETRFEGEFVRFSNFETRFDNPEVQFNGNNVNFHNNHTTFNGEVRLEGPITEPKHATTKEYVDALSTRSAARVAALANVDLQNASPEIDGVTLAAGDRVLLAGQTSAAENGLYVADANGALTRAGDFDAANEIDGGAHLFIQEGSQASQGYVLADLGENFELGTGELSFSRFTVDPTQSLELGNDLNVAGTINAQDIQTGNINAERLYLEGGPFGDTRFDGDFNRLGGFETRFEGEFVRFSNFETRFDNPEVQFNGNNVNFHNNHTTFNGEVRLEGPITEPKHATTKEYVDALSTRSAARVAALANVDLQNASPEIDGVTLAAGDRVLLAGQTSAAENGLYVADANGALTRAGDFDAANEIDGGAHLFIQEGSQASQGYVLADLGENFELGTGELSFSRFTVDPTQSLELGNDLNVAGTINAQDIQTGNINAERLYLEGGPFGDTRFDGDFNRLGGF